MQTLNRLDDQHLINIGYCKLVAAIVWTAVNPYTDDDARKNISFARNSRLLDYFCDAFEYDYDRMQKRIIEINEKFLGVANMRRDYFIKK